MLIDPVRHERAGDPGVPPRLGAGVLQPLPRDVPVVDDVVVVEDHQARDGRQQPTDVGVGPGLAVEARVLLEVGDLLPRRLGRVAPAADELRRLGRHLVGVHLVTAQEERVGPRLDARLEPPGVRPQRVDAEPVLVLARRERVRLALGSADAARPEHEPGRILALPGMDRAGGALAAGRRPDAVAVEEHLVRDHAPLGEVLHLHQGVVVAAHLERAGDMAERPDVAWAVGLDPEGRLGTADVPQERAEDE